jgi:hypothetical protein
MQFVSKRMGENGPIGIDMWTVCLLENGYGQRYCNILKNGIIVTDSSLVRSSEEWKKQIEPWLTNQTDFIPLQDGIMNAKIALSVLEFKKEIDKFNNK